MSDVKLSIILPVRNGGRTLYRTLSSIEKQSFKDYEVVIINDSSQDNSLEEIIKFSYTLPLHLINVNLDVHCAGNSRNVGLNCARGEWVTFIDQDDEFEDSAFENVMSLISNNGLEYICCTMLYEYDEKTGEVTRHSDIKDNIDVWLHGKYYNRENLLNTYNLRFKKDLKYLEDLFFNTKALEILFTIGVINKPTFTYYLIDTYKWYETGQSTHSSLVEGKYVFNHWGVAHHYCENVLVPLLNQWKVSKNIESNNAIKKMAYADLGYAYVNYLFLRYYYGEDDPIVDVMEQSILQYLPEIVSNMKIKNVFDCVNNTIDFTIKNSGLSEEEINKIMNISFAEWWNYMLTKCSIK